MTIPQKAWENYIGRMGRLSRAATADLRKYVEKNGMQNANNLIGYAYGVVTKYGEGAAALAAQMYDAIAELEGALLPPAELAETATIDEVARTMQGILNTTQNEEIVSSAAGRMVKQAGADTTLKNAIRDGAEWAWVPHGDTCMFCLTLAANDWQPASQKILKGGHAQHIHSNCDCQFAVRHDRSTTVAGYEPKKYLDMHEHAPLDLWNTRDGKPPAGHEGAERDTAQNKINAMRRQAYAENKAEINAQKRAAYAKRRELESSRAEEIDVNGG